MQFGILPAAPFVSSPIYLFSFSLSTLNWGRFYGHVVRVWFRLVEEVYEITETVEQLRAKLREMENALQHLLRTKMSLEHDLTVKNNSIYVDREMCLGKRKNFPLSVSVVY